MPRPHPPTIDVLVNANCWEQEADGEAVVARAIEAAAAAAPPPTAGAEIAVMLTDDAAMRELNRAWRNIDKPTNVLSFPAAPAAGAGAPRHLGDIAIAFETARREAATEGKPFVDHLSHLAVHGYLHLIGYDHETESEAEAMEALERDILARLGIADPYEPAGEAV